MLKIEKNIDLRIRKAFMAIRKEIQWDLFLSHWRWSQVSSKDRPKEEKDRFIINKDNIRPRVAVNKIHRIELKAGATRPVIWVVEELVAVGHLDPAQTANKTEMPIYVSVVKTKQTNNPVILRLLF